MRKVDINLLKQLCDQLGASFEECKKAEREINWQ